MRQFLFLFGFVLLSFSSRAQDSFAEKCQSLLAHPKFEGASVGIGIWDLDSSVWVYKYQEDLQLTPASNVKLFTTAAAMRHLDADFKFSTVYGIYGSIRNAVLNGEIRIEGNGDPSLASGKGGAATSSDSILMKWVQILKQKGIDTIQGTIVIEPEHFPGPKMPLSWEWGDFGDCYAQGYWPLNWEENCFRVDLNKDSIGYYLEKDDEILPWRVVYQVDPDTKKDISYVTLAPDGYTYWIGGPANPGIPFSLRVAMSHPPFYVRERLVHYLEKNGIQLTDWDWGQTDLPFIASDTIWSPTLSALIQTTNSESNNLYAEALLRAVGQKLYGRSSLSSALKALQQTYKWLAPNGSSLSLYDGSGMSRHNALSAASIIKLLDHVAADSLNFVDYKNSLSIPGVQGTLAYRMKKLPGKMKVWAKTGSLSRVKSLSGYIELSNGRKYAFSILANQYGGDANSFYRFIEDILELVQRNEEDIK
jgi:D-alanyl-D-alanine carboxypeptidase/D-alanyl-D-alanine-endopeptidase (penicillin-binding protein 4)